MFESQNEYEVINYAACLLFHLTIKQNKIEEFSRECQIYELSVLGVENKAPRRRILLVLEYICFYVSSDLPCLWRTTRATERIIKS